MPQIQIDPPRESLLAVATRLGATNRLLQPKLDGVQHIPERGPFMLVGNHTLYGLQDVPSLIYEIKRARGVLVRPLGDHAHFAIPLWRNLLTELGMVRGTPANRAALLDAGVPVMVFPGGAHEVFKRRHQHYQLMWRERLGFARLAAERGCPIVPFAAVGADDTYTVLTRRRPPAHQTRPAHQRPRHRPPGQCPSPSPADWDQRSSPAPSASTSTSHRRLTPRTYTDVTPTPTPSARCATRSKPVSRTACASCSPNANATLTAVSFPASHAHCAAAKPNT